jgi:predicted ATPase
MMQLINESQHETLSHVLWDQERIKDLLCAPNRLVREEPWGGWIKQSGGLAGVYTQLRALPLPEHQRQLLSLLLELPRVPVKSYAARLNIDRATFFRHRAALISSLTRHLNSTPAVAPSRPAQPERAQHARLPAVATSFVGRVQELATLRALLLEPQPRLLTILGPGGCGKSRLAREAAQQVQQQFEHGVAWVGLAGVRTPIDMLRALTKALGLEDDPSQSLFDQLCGFVQGRRMLLVLDNAEQLREAAPLLASLLERAPGLKIMATSRAPLHLRVEASLSLAPLAVPDLAQLPPYDELANFPALQLFVERARETVPYFQLNHLNAAAIAEICARGDGLPLAMELAARRMRYLAPQVLLGWMRSRLDMFDDGPADLPARQRGLRQLYNWSYALLSSEAQALFRRLAIFAGGWTIEAAEQVCRSHPGARHELLSTLMQLLDQSLIQRQAAAELGGEDRYCMLESVREYGLERLEGCGERGMLRQRHAAYFGSLAVQAEASLRGREAQHWRAWLVREAANLAAIHLASHEHGEPLAHAEHELLQPQSQLAHALPRAVAIPLREPPLQAVVPGATMLH